MSSGSAGSSFSWNTICIFTMLDCRSLRERSMSTLPWERIPT